MFDYFLKEFSIREVFFYLFNIKLIFTNKRVFLKNVWQFNSVCIVSLLIRFFPKNRLNSIRYLTI